MFGKDKGKSELVGAKEKLQRAQMLKTGMTMDEIKSKREGKQGDSTNATVALIYILSCTVAFFLTQGPWKNGVHFKIGHDGLDSLLFATGTPSFFGEPTVDFCIQVAARGLMLFLLSGLLPGLGFLWMRCLDKAKMNPFRAVWGVTIGLGVVYFIVTEFLIPALEMIFT